MSVSLSAGHQLQLPITTGRQIDALDEYHAIVPCTRTVIGIVGPDWKQLQHGTIVYHATVSRTWTSVNAWGTMQFFHVQGTFAFVGGAMV